MDRVFTFADAPAEAGHWVVVAVGEPNPDQRHIGILHRNRNAHLQFLHLAWHCRLRNDDNRPDYVSVWVAPSVPAERQRIMAAFCRRVWRKNERDGIPYADYESWPADRDGDSQWQQSIITKLDSQQTEQDHIEHLRSEIGAVRFRPEEVAASTAYAPPPVAFLQAEEDGQQILNRIRDA